MAEFWTNDPVLTEATPDTADWWKQDPVDQAPSAAPEAYLSTDEPPKQPIEAVDPLKAQAAARVSQFLRESKTAALRKEKEDSPNGKVASVAAKAIEHLEGFLTDLNNPLEAILEFPEHLWRSLGLASPYTVAAPLISPETTKKAVTAVTGGTAEESVGQAAEEFVSEMISGMSNPAMIGYLMLGAKAPTPVGRYFQGEMLAHLPESITAISQADTGKEKTKAALGVAAELAFPVLIEKGIRRHEAPKPAQVTTMLLEQAKEVGPATEAAISGKEPTPVAPTPEPAVPPAMATGELAKSAATETPVAAEPSLPTVTTEPPVRQTGAGAETATPVAAKKVRPPEDRPFDLIDQFVGQIGGKLSLTKAKKLISDFQPVGALRDLFTSKGMAPDVAAQVVGFKGSDVEFLEALQRAALARKGNRLAKRQEVAQLRQMEKQGDLLSKQEEPLALVGEKGVDLERVARKKASAEAKLKVGKEATGELVGLGAATPAEFELSPKTATGIKNATVDRERQTRGLPPVMQPARRSFGAVWDQAMAKIDQDPGYTDRLLAEVRDKPRALTDLEDATVLHRQIELQNEYGKATRDLAQAFDDGRMQDVDAEKIRVIQLSDQLLDLYNVGKAVGTETGRGLAARKMMAYEDFSLAKMEVEKRAAKGGAPLTDVERAQVIELNKKIDSTQKAYDEYVAKAEERIRQMEIDRAYADLQKQAARDPQVDPKVKSLADRIVESLGKQASESREYLRGKVFTISPDVLFHLSRIGAAQIARGVLDFSRWSVDMLGEFGDSIRPYLQEVFDASSRLLDSQVEGIAGKKRAPRVKRTVIGADIAEQQKAVRETITERIKANELDAVAPLVQKLARLFVEQGVKERDPLIDAVHGVLKEIDPQITRREAMDAISGYGKYKQLTKDEISVKLRDLKGQMQQVGKLEDIESRKPPLKTGVERRAPTDEERRLIKLVNEAKRKFGIVITDPATQLRSALQARKTYYQNQIADLEAQIGAKEKFVKEKTPSPTDPELDALKAKRDALKKDFDDVFGKPELTEEQRIARAANATKRSIGELTRRINEGDLEPKAKKPQPTSPALEALRGEREQLRSMLDELKEAANPKKTPEERALQTLKTRLKNEMAKLEDRMKKGDFNKREPRKIQLDPEAHRLHFEAAKVKARWLKALIKDQQARRSLPRKIIGGIGETINTIRAIITSGEFSGVLRQGGFVGIGNPIRIAKAFPAMFRAFRSESQQHAVNLEIMARPNYLLYVRSKLYLAEHGQKLSQMEEAYMSRWAEKIPLVAGTQRAYSTFLNKLRADSFDAMTRTLVRRTGELTPERANAIANYINVATGRGNLAAKEGTLVGLNTYFFAPRWVMSRLQLLLGQPFLRGDKHTRRLIAEEYGKFLIGMSVIYGLWRMAGEEVEDDPRSSDFGKFVLGNTRVDLMAGLQQGTVLLSRLVTGETKRLSGRVVPIRGQGVPFGSGDSAEVIGRFLRTKLAPVPSSILDVLSGEDVVGKPVSLASEIIELSVPLTYRDIYKAMREQGVPAGTALSLLAIFGAGVQTYDE